MQLIINMLKLVQIFLIIRCNLQISFGSEKITQFSFNRNEIKNFYNGAIDGRFRCIKLFVNVQICEREIV